MLLSYDHITYMLRDLLEAYGIGSFAAFGVYVGLAWGRKSDDRKVI